MEFEQALYEHLAADAAVAALVGDRIYPLVAPQGATYPALVYQRVSTRRPQTLGGSAGVATPWMQVRCWARSYSEARSVIAAVRAALADFRGGMGDSGEVVVQETAVENEMHEYENETRLYGPILDVRMTHEEALA